MKTIVLAALIVMNCFTFVLYGVDKRRAKKKKWRIKESTLLTCTWLLGGIGAFLGMRVFHHKTLHKAFVFSAWTSGVLTLAVLIWAALML